MAANALIALPRAAVAVDWSVSWESRARLAQVRGVSLDSIPAADVVTLPNGSQVTPDGIAVRVRPGSSFATFFRPGELRRSGPLSTTLDAAAWGVGVAGFSAHATLRLAHDAGDVDWPGTEPSARLLEGYAEWTAARASVRAGRLHESTRLGFVGFDGGSGELRFSDGRAVLATYGGWGLARAEALPATHEVLVPLDDFLPERRQLVWGARGDWRAAPLQIGTLYQREIDPRAGDFVSERVGAQAIARVRGLELATGADYDVAAADWGRAEAGLALRRQRAGAEVGWRRYAPHFPLWTIWGAFSPVPYDAWSARGRVALGGGLELNGGGERWEYDDPGATTPLVVTEDEGWRWTAGARWLANPDREVRGAYWREYGPGAAASGFETGAALRWRRALSLDAGFSWMRRPLELRFDESQAATWTLRASWAPRGRWRAGVDVQHVDVSRGRPDAAAFDGGHWRLGVSTAIAFDSGAIRTVPPAILRIPELPE